MPRHAFESQIETNLVHRIGDEEIAGTKTFSKTLVITEIHDTTTPLLWFKDLIWTGNGVKIFGAYGGSVKFSPNSMDIAMVNGADAAVLRNTYEGLTYSAAVGGARIFHIHAGLNRTCIGGPYNEPSALLDLKSTNAGFLLPRMTSAQRDAIASPAEGLQIYNLTTHEINFYNGTGWRKVADTAA